jgi:hypothetical protein
VTGDWRKLHNKELHKNNYNDQVKEDEIGRARSTNGEKRIPHRILLGSQKERDH